MKSIFLALQDTQSRSWFPVARVTREQSRYSISYTKGALEISGFVGFGRMKDLYKEYVSEELFPLLSNRTLPASRPEYKKYLGWLGLDSGHDVLDELARTGGLRATDDVELIPKPEPTKDNKFELFFFVRGMRHMPIVPDVELSEGDRLLIVGDFQNEYDFNALLLRSEKPMALVGYVPRYHSGDIYSLLRSVAHKNISVKVHRINDDAPSPYRVLCRLESMWPDDFSPCSSKEFEVLTQNGVRFS